jgi:4-hydroxy-tetrahydrodipicolinate reductase
VSVRLAVHGACGRMGLAVVRAAHEAGHTLVGAIESASSPHLGRDVGELAGLGSIGVAVSPDVSAGLLGASVVVDFSLAGAVPSLLRAAQRAEVAVVSGTTRLDDAGKRALDEASRSVPVLWAPNMSVGVHVLAELVRRAVGMLGPGFDVEIVEVHHKKKVDAPSGTAVRLFEAAREAREGLGMVTGREGDVGPRGADEAAVLAVRGGDVIGDHTVYLLGPGERLELSHRASSRELFALGALRAAAFVAGKPPGRYELADVVGRS